MTQPEALSGSMFGSLSNLEIELTTKFRTNMDGNANFPGYAKTNLQFMYFCDDPTEGSNLAAAIANGCSSSLFSLVGQKLILQE